MSTPPLSEIARKICSLRQLSLEEFLGQGAFKQTFRATTASGQAVALKIAATSPLLQPRLERESDALRDCAHPGIATLIECFAFEVDGARYWISLEEFIPGGTLEKRLTAAKLTASETRELLLALAQALAHLHERQLVHRDIKPENILFRQSGEAVLTDFGLVRVLEKPSLTHDFQPRGPGTPLYAPPEQLLNEKAEIDWRSDQFALALVGCKCLLGVHPFAPAGTAHDAVTAVMERKCIPSDMKHQLLEAGLPALVRALEPWSVNRYRWPDKFIAALKEPKGVV